MSGTHRSFLDVKETAAIVVVACLAAAAGRWLLDVTFLPASVLQDVHLNSLHLWLLASVATWLALARLLRDASNERTVLVGLASVALGATLLFLLAAIEAYLLGNDLPLNPKASIWLLLWYPSMMAISVPGPVSLPTGVVTSFLMRWAISRINRRRGNCAAQAEQHAGAHRHGLAISRGRRA